MSSREYFCINKGEYGDRTHCALLNLPQCVYCANHIPEPQISEERYFHLISENDEIDLVEKLLTLSLTVR